MTDTNSVDRAYEWDDEIENDSPDFVLLPEGEYPFEVVSFERERHGGSAKLPPCNKAVVHLRFDGGELGSTTVKENLFLHSKTEGILCSFFTSIGQRQHGEKLKMNWGTVIGSKGRAKLAVRTWDRDDGTQGKANQVKKYIEPSETSGTGGASYTPGAF